MLQCALELFDNINRDHGEKCINHVGCVEAAQAASMAAASKPSLDAFQAMMRLDVAKQAAATANAAVVAAERAKEAAEAESEGYERALGKRPRSETDETATSTLD